MGKEYRINLTKRYNVTFVKDGVKYKTGDEVSVGMALASKFYAEGKIEATNELINDARALVARSCSLNVNLRKKIRYDN